MIRFSLRKFIFIAQLGVLIFIYISYIIFIIDILTTKTLSRFESAWLIILSVIGLFWISSLLLKIKIIKRYVRRLFVLNINLLFNNRIIWSVLGVLNKRLRLIKTIFLAYPANNNFAKEYVFDSVLEETRWHPWFTGFFIQNGKVGLKFAISSTESDFRDENNLEQLRSLWFKMSYLKHLLESDQVTFAGVLPGIFYKKNIIHRLPIELDNTVQAVKKAVLSVIVDLQLDIDTPIIVLGGKGFIGNKFMYEMSDRKVYSIDIKDKSNKHSLDKIIDSAKSKVIILNVASQRALLDNLLYFNEKVIIINEVYPEPSVEIINKIKSQGGVLFHIVGVAGRSFPRFPRAYRNGIPCCASWNSENTDVKLIKI
jgi:hypothetical protein